MRILLSTFVSARHHRVMCICTIGILNKQQASSNQFVTAGSGKDSQVNPKLWREDDSGGTLTVAPMLARNANKITRTNGRLIFRGLMFCHFGVLSCPKSMGHTLYWKVAWKHVSPALDSNAPAFEIDAAISIFCSRIFREKKISATTQTSFEMLKNNF